MLLFTASCENSKFTYIYEVVNLHWIILAISAPVCDPTCGPNAHCEYGLTNRCVCDPGQSGNPYEGCGAQERTTCDPQTCGVGAECRESARGISCICPSGYIGNPHVQCHDIDECLGPACGQGAVCINTAGSYDCR